MRCCERSACIVFGRTRIERSVLRQTRWSNSVGELSPSATASESDSVPSDYWVVVYYAARGYVELQTPTITGGIVEVGIPFSIVPRKLATAMAGDRLRIQFRGKGMKPSPTLKVRIAHKQKALGRHVLQLEILDWDKLARYWRIRIEAPDVPS